MLSLKELFLILRLDLLQDPEDVACACMRLQSLEPICPECVVVSMACHDGSAEQGINSTLSCLGAEEAWKKQCPHGHHQRVSFESLPLGRLCPGSPCKFATTKHESSLAFERLLGNELGAANAQLGIESSHVLALQQLSGRWGDV